MASFTLSTAAVLFLSFNGILAQPIVNIGKTKIVGRKMVDSSVEFFGGIPYALPPVGELRLNLPVLSPMLDAESFDATKFGPGCLQIIRFAFPSPPSGVSEDCLSLSIFRPSRISSDERLPVIVWIYGGGYIIGDSSFYDGTNLVIRSVERNTPIIYVSINYRLGPLGFPSGREASQRRVLNLGLHDTLVALEWIQANIVNFSGDKTKVTAMGESAGATSIAFLLQQTKINGLARAAIVESVSQIPLYGPEKTESAWESYVSAVPGCASRIAQNKSIDCLRRSDTTSLLQAQVANNIVFGDNVFSAVIDGPDGLIVGRWSQNLPQSHIPLLLGNNVDEATLFEPQNTNSSEEIRAQLLNSISPPILNPAEVEKGLDTILELYPDVPSLGSPFGTGNDTFGLNSQYKRISAIVGDFLFISGRRLIARKMSSAGAKVFAYYFTDHEAIPFPEFLPTGVIAPGSLGVPHTAEIAYVFGTLTNVSSEAKALSTIMQDYWISFATSLDPNDNHGAKRPHWEQYTPQKQAMIRLEGSGITMITDNFRAKQIAFWEDNPDLLNT